MANELNKLFSGLYAGANQLAQGIYAHQDNVESDKLYNTSLKSLQDLLSKYTGQTNTIADQGEVPLTQRNNATDISNTGNNTSPYQKLDSKLIDENTIQVQKKPVSMQDLYGKLQSTQNELLKYGEVGKQRAGLLGDYFSQMLKMQPNEKILETKDGLFTYRTDNPTGTLKLIQPFEKKPEKPNYKLGDYAKMTLADVENLSPDEFKKGFDSFSEETKQAIFSKYPEKFKQYQDKYNEGEFATKKSGRSGYRSRGRGTTGKMTQEEQDQVKNLEMIAKGEADDEEIKQLADAYGITEGELRQQAEDYYKGNKSAKDVTENLVEGKDLNKKQNKIGNDLINFQNDIEQNVYAYKDNEGNLQPNYNISPADWARELVEGGFFDGIDEEEYQTISNWFRSKTGRNLKEYVN